VTPPILYLISGPENQNHLYVQQGKKKSQPLFSPPSPPSLYTFPLPTLSLPSFLLFLSTTTHPLPPPLGVYLLFYDPPLIHPPPRTSLLPPTPTSECLPIPPFPPVTSVPVSPSSPHFLISPPHDPPSPPSPHPSLPVLSLFFPIYPASFPLASSSSPSPIPSRTFLPSFLLLTIPSYYWFHPPFFPPSPPLCTTPPPPSPLSQDPPHSPTPPPPS